MASVPAAVTTETPITLKINHAGVTKKFKLPLRDLVASSFEDKLRDTLLIDPSVSCHFERYSDSAGSYIILDRNNQSVYKQLYRAAKAKQKLKLRVVEAAPAPAPKPAPRSVTVEDVPEPKPEVRSATDKPSTVPVIVPSSASSAAARAEEDRMQYPAIPGRFPGTSSLTEDYTNMWRYDVDAQLAATLKNMARNHELLERNIARLGASVAEMGWKAEKPTASAVSSSSTSASASASACTGASTSSSISAAAIVDAVAKPSGKTEKVEEKKANVEPVAAAEEPAASPAPESTPAMPCKPRQPPVWSFMDGPSVAKTSLSPCLRAGFSVCCNSCERTIPDTHYHCSTCEEGDFDLCQTCVDLGITCYNHEHWMIKRNIKDGSIVNSTTERMPTKDKTTKPAEDKAAEAAPAEEKPKSTKGAKPAKTSKTTKGRAAAFSRSMPLVNLPKAAASTAPAMSTLSELFNGASHVQMRTCNNCIKELPEVMFLHCASCYDFDLCKECFIKNEHGHHPKHAFSPAVPGTLFDSSVTRRLAAGRGQRHNAVCDECEKFISGVRHKCLNCPDWDYCSDCFGKADFLHPGHRFVPIYEYLNETSVSSTSPRQIHAGIYCDGPHCISAQRNSRAIVGDRYKCAVCYNLDFCATCEASPANTHNKTHPLIKFRTPIRHVSVVTTGEHDGQPMPTMGDACVGGAAVETPQRPAQCPCDINLNKVQTVVDVKPTEAEFSAPALVEEKTPEPTVEPEVKAEEPTPEPSAEHLDAMFERDTVADGTALPPSHVFEQTWVLRNTGSVAWPAGCCVRYVSGDYMGHVDPNHPAGIQELVSASESTISYEPVAPGSEFPFTVLLRTPTRAGKAISYWRLTSRGGIKFGDRLWCDVTVQPKEETKEEVKEEVKEEPKEEPKAEAEIKEEPKEKTVEPIVVVEEAPKQETTEVVVKKEVEGSQMIFPKLEKESPGSSVYYSEAHAEPSTAPPATDNFDFDWADDDSEEGFLTDDEYDILDASDEEFPEEHSKTQKK